MDNQISGMRSILDDSNEPLGVKIRTYYKRDWIFSTKLEKSIVVGMLIWTIYSIGRWLFRLI